MAKTIDLDAAPTRFGTAYPPPFNTPCLERKRWKLGDAAGAKREHDIVVGLLRSIRTGDGSSPAQAFTPISVGEEYAVMRAFDMRVGDQELIQAAGHSYDKLDVTDSDGKKLSFYFQIDRIVAAERAELAH